MLEGRAESYDLGRRSLQDELAGLEADEAVEGELQALRARLRPGEGNDPSVS